MDLFKWFRRDPESRGLVRGRAVAIPHYPSSETTSNVVENFGAPDSVSTLSVTVCPLADGESAEEVGARFERFAPVGMFRTTPVPKGCARVHGNVPNWVHLLVRQTGHVHRMHTEVPVWVDPNTGRIDRMDTERLVESLLPERERAHELFRVAGMTAPMSPGSSADSAP